MKTLALVALVSSLLASREAAAQTFFYGAPAYSDFYGVNLGNGIGLGYGIGMAVPLNVLNSSVTDTYIPPFHEFCESNPPYIVRGAVAAPQVQVLQTPLKNLPTPLKKKPTPTKKKALSKVSLPKAKPLKQGAGKTGDSGTGTK